MKPIWSADVSVTWFPNRTALATAKTFTLTLHSFGGPRDNDSRDNLTRTLSRFAIMPDGNWERDGEKWRRKFKLEVKR